MTTAEARRKRIRWALVAAFSGAIVGMVIGWLVAIQLQGEKVAAQQGRREAVTEKQQAEQESSAKDATLEALCADGINAACDALASLDVQPAPNEPELQELEIQEPEVQEPEIQERENQEPEIQEAPINGVDGVDGARGASCVEELGVDACKGPKGDKGDKGDTGDRGPAGTARPGTYACPEGEYQRGFTVHDDGSVTLLCEPLPTPPGSSDDPPV